MASDAGLFLRVYRDAIILNQLYTAEFTCNVTRTRENTGVTFSLHPGNNFRSGNIEETYIYVCTSSAYEKEAENKNLSSSLKSPIPGDCKGRDHLTDFQLLVGFQAGTREKSLRGECI